MKGSINPVYKKELKVTTRSVRLSLMLFSFNALLGILGILAFYVDFEGDSYQTINYGDVLVIYSLIVGLEFALLLFAVPALTANAIAGEREKQTLEILLTTPLSPGQIIRGKLLSSISTMLLLLVSSLPVLSLVFAVGGVRFVDLLQFIFTACVTAVFIGSIGIMFSALFKRTVPATVATYGTVLVLILGTMALVFAVYRIQLQSYDAQYYMQNVAELEYAPPGVGGLIYVMLLNPAVTLLSMLTRQYGSMETLKEFFDRFGGVKDELLYQWYAISTIVQLVISAVLLGFARKHLKIRG